MRHNTTNHNHHVDVLGRADGLVIKRVHGDLGHCQTYAEDVAKQNLYVTEINWCDDPECVDHDITRQPGDD
jgi:hypothetical protein